MVFKASRFRLEPTPEQAHVKAKSGLNKSILDQRWYAFRRLLAYKIQWLEGFLVLVDPRNPSRTYLEYGHVSAEQRRMSTWPPIRLQSSLVMASARK